MRKLLASLVAAVTLAAGGLALAFVNPFSGAAAQDPGGTVEPEQRERGRRGRVLGEALAELVQEGTLTQEQADAVTERVAGKVEDRPGRGGHRRFKAWREAVGTAAETIGISPQDVAAELRSGKSIAQVVGEKGVDPQTVIDALVTEGTAAIDRAVADGKISPERAERAKAKLPDAAKRIVERTRGG